MANEIYFYMTRTDLQRTLTELSTTARLKCVGSKKYASANDVITRPVDELQNVGIAEYGSEMQEEAILILPDDQLVSYTPIKHTDETTSIYVGPSDNPGAIILWAGGEYGDNCLIRGRLKACSKSTLANQIHRELIRILRLTCVVMNHHYLGTQAVDRLKSGVRLTHSIHADPKYDFRLPDQQV